MTVETLNRKTAPIQGNGVITTFDYNFKINTTDDIMLVKENTVTSVITDILSTEYTVNPNDNYVGGTVTYPKLGGSDAILTSDEVLVIYREVDKHQEVNLKTQGMFKSPIVEDVLDKLVMRDQELQEEVDRCLKQGISSLVTFDDYFTAILNMVNQLNLVFTPQQVTASTATTVIDVSLGNIITLTLSSNTVVSFTGITHPTNIRLTVLQSSGGVYNLTFSDDIKAPYYEDLSPTTDAVSNMIDVYQLWSDENEILYISLIGRRYTDIADLI